MTEQEARNLLYDLWQNGEIPDNFNENHSDFEKAIKYILTNGEFDYNDFTEKIIIIKFGIWQVESDALVAKNNHDYIIGQSRLWEIRDYNGYLVWSWLIHLTEKPWITIENINDLNTAFFFCQDYFKEFKPTNLAYISTAQTLNIQKQLMEIRNEMSKSEKIDKNGTLQANVERTLMLRDLKSSIKFL